MRPAFQTDDDLLADIESTAGGSPGDLHLWWLGQSGFLAISGGERVVFDPYLSDSLTRKYADTDRPHVRMIENVIAPDRLAGVSAVTSTHNHTDHLDAETLAPLFASNPGARLVLPAANVAFAANRLGWPESDPRFATVDSGGSVTVGAATFHGVPAAHEALDTDDLGRNIYLGYVLTLNGWRIYHAGDTILYPGMAEILRPFGVDIALLPINGRGPERHVSGNLWGDEAARLAKDIGAKLAVPCHFDLFEFNTDTPERFESECQRVGQAFRTLRVGERLTRALTFRA